MTTPVKGTAQTVSEHAGAGPHYYVGQTLIGGGGTNNMTTNPVQSSASNVPPCCNEIASVVYNAATGTYLVTFIDSYYAVIDWNVAIDDINGSTPVQGYLGQWSNLGCLAPATVAPVTCVLTTYAGGAASNVALGTPVRIRVAFKKSPTGAAA